ncbi:cytochrome P450 [Streptomyces sp. NPDC090025]|uniref:cytochrome P450 n=1 Tax=Streptomyces sp. NPDC090025 TaxID=3365922 RepID=UPI003837E38E
MSGAEDGPDGARELVLRFLDGAARADPYPLLHRIRAAGPVWLDDATVVLSSRAHCGAALRAADTTAAGADGCPAASVRLRRGLDRAASAWDGPALAPLVGRLVDDRLDSVAARGRLDVVSDLAHPVPLAVLSHLLGLPAADAPWLHRRAMALTPAPDHLGVADRGGMANPGAVADAAERNRQADAELAAYFAEAVRDRRRHGHGDDVLSLLIRPDEHGERLTDAEAAAVGQTLFTSGYEPTAALVSAGVLALLRAPHETDTLRRDPGHARHLVEETLRLDPPVQFVRRTAGADLDLDGTTVPRGTVMVLLLAAAHRDPASSASPDVFAPDGASPHLAFAAGAHACPGAPWARLVATTVLVRFAQRVRAPRFALGSPSYRPTAALRGLRALWVDADGFAGRDLPWQPPTR